MISPALNSPLSASLNSPQTKIIGLWLIPFLVPLLPFFPPSTAGGGTWRVELFTGVLLAGFVFFAARKLSRSEISFHASEFLFIYAPLLCFIVWSGFSAFWAESAKNAWHHTLVWACYLIFYALIRQNSVGNKHQRAFFVVSGVMIWIISVCGAFNYFAAPADGLNQQGINFSRYSEIFVTILPIYLVLSTTLKNRRLAFLSGATAALAWISILCSFNRTCTLLGIFVLAAIGVAGLFKFISGFRFKFYFINFAVFAAAILLTQFYFSANSNSPNTLSRFTDKSDPIAVEGAAMRPLFAGIAVEMLGDSPLSGIGADNFNLKYAEARREYSADKFDNPRIAIYEHVLAERAHNEYLQILAELGAIGGVLFLWLIGGIALLFPRFRRNRKTVSPIVPAAFLGLFAFLCSSLVSSYSFRVMQNGLIFFFVLALLAAKLFSSEKSKNHQFSYAPRFVPAFGVLAIAVCLSLTLLSATRAASQYYLTAANAAENFDSAAPLYEKATFFNDDNPAVYFSYGTRLLLNERPTEAAPILQKAVDKGMSPSACFSYLASAQFLAGEPLAAEATMRRATEIYPRSVFARSRYAALLARNGKFDLSEEQRKIAARIDEKQASGWWLVINEGAGAAARFAIQNENTAQPMDLKPSAAVYAVLDERRLTNPFER